MKQARVETVFAGAQHSVPQAAGLGRALLPNCLVPVRYVESPQQCDVRPLAGDDQPARCVEARFELVIAEKRGGLRRRRFGLGGRRRNRLRRLGPGGTRARWRNGWQGAEQGGEHAYKEQPWRCVKSGKTC